MGSRNFAELVDALWILICTYLKPIERIRLNKICKDINNILSYSKNKYPFIAFSEQDIHIWSKYCASCCNHTNITCSNFAYDTFNLTRFDCPQSDALSSMKYFFVFYSKLVHSTNSKFLSQEALPIQQEKDFDQENAFFKWHDGSSLPLKEFVYTNNQSLRMIIGNNLYIPTFVNKLFLSFANVEHINTIISWICNILCYCDKYCLFLQHIYFRRSNLNNQHIINMCNSLQKRKEALISLQYLDLSCNDISDDCIHELLHTVNEFCPNLTHLDLSTTSVTNRTCEIIKQFYIHNMPQFKEIHLKDNKSIDSNGIEKLNDIFVALDQVDAHNDVELRFIVYSSPNADWNSNIIVYDWFNDDDFAALNL